MATTPVEPNPTTVLILGEASRAVDAQFAQIDSLNTRAQQLLGFAGIVISVVVGLGAQNETVPAVLLGIGVGIFALVAVLGLRAWGIYGYRRDPAPRPLWESFRNWPTDWLREQLIWNLIASHEHNARAIDAKLIYLRRTQFLLAVEVAYLAAVLVALPFIA